MKKVLSSALVLLLVLCMFFALPINASAESVATQDGLEVVILTDKDEYTAEEEISLSISITNTNGYLIEGISIQTLLPEGLKIKSGDLSFENISIAAGDTYATTVTTVDSDVELPPQDENDDKKEDDTSKNEGETSKKEETTDKKEDTSKKDTSKKDKVSTSNKKTPNTGDKFNALLWIVLFSVSALGLIFIIRNKNIAKVLSLVLCVAIVLTVVSTGIFADETDASFMVEKTIRVEGISHTIKAQVVYPKSAIKTSHIVTFVSNGGSAVQSQCVINGERALEPNAPVKLNHEFDGWYLDENFERFFSFTTAISSDITLYAKWKEIDGGVATGFDNSVNVYSISALDVNRDQGTVTATVTAPENCGLIVRFIPEEIYFSAEYPANKSYINDGNTIASHVVAANSDMEEITAAVSNLLPPTFVAEAVLVDVNGDELCAAYTSVANTERYRTYDAMSVYDFAEDNLVLNFDGDVSNNFGVLADDVKILTADDVVAENTDGDSVVYKILNPSEPIEQGDKIFISDQDGNYLFKVIAVETQDDYITVIPAMANSEIEGFRLNDFYKFIKVDMEYNSEADNGNNTTPISTFSARASRSSNVVDVSENLNGSATLPFSPLSFETEHFKATAKMTGTINANLVLEWDELLFGEYMRCDFTYTTDTITKIEVENKVNGAQLENAEIYSGEHNFGTVNIPFAVTGVVAKAKISILTDWENTDGFKAEVVSKTESGFKYSNIEGFQKVDTRDNNWTVESYGINKVKFGPKHYAKADVLDGVLNCGVDCFFGAEFRTAQRMEGSDEPDYIHACGYCVDGTLNAAVNIDADCSYKITETLTTVDVFDFNVVTLDNELFDFYVSLQNESDSLFGGQKHIGTGECPNKLYKTTVYARNAQGQNLNCQVKLYKQEDNSLVTTFTAGSNIYLYPSQYVAKVTIDGEEYEKSFVVADGVKVVTITETNAESVVRGSVVDVETGIAISNAAIEVYEHSTLVYSAFTDSTGAFNIALVEGDYEIRVTKSGYISASQRFTLREGEDKYLESFKLAKEDRANIMGGIYGTIVDAVTGMPLSDVDIKISKGWGNLADSPTTELVAEKKTDYNGCYEHKKTSVMGVDFGLDAGDYTVTISRQGYISTSFNITIVGGQDKMFNSSITPVGGEDIYHIVLTWGENPNDLDSHFNADYEGEREHICYYDRLGSKANLDVDDTSSYGPETITIEDISAYENIRYSVHDYTNRYSTDSTELSFSSATVKVYRGGELLETFYVPTGSMATVWNVFYIDENHNIRPINTFEIISEPENVGAVFNN